ncbi:BMP-binding endothelial regulator protein isoform X3 [Procambarus clarkii]
MAPHVSAPAAQFSPGPLSGRMRLVAPHTAARTSGASSVVTGGMGDPTRIPLPGRESAATRSVRVDQTGDVTTSCVPQTAWTSSRHSSPERCGSGSCQASARDLSTPPRPGRSSRHLADRRGLGNVTDTTVYPSIQTDGARLLVCLQHTCNTVNPTRRLSPLSTPLTAWLSGPLSIVSSLEYLTSAPSLTRPLHTMFSACLRLVGHSATKPATQPTPPLPDKDRGRGRAHTTSGRSGLGVLLVILHLLAHTTPTLAFVESHEAGLRRQTYSGWGAGPEGVPMRCHEEGEVIKVPREVERDNPCISCSCQNKIVMCNRKCPSLEGCYWKMEQDPKQCCQVCKGCEHKGKWHQHGAHWSDGCHHYQCLSGVLTVSKTQCHLPCTHPRPAHGSSCCPTCSGCWLEGRPVIEGEVIVSRVDPCVRCKCSRGSLSCEKKACPVLSCPPAKQVSLPDTCCKSCQGSRELIPPPGGRCFLNGHLYTTGVERTLDPCTTCACHQGYITCQRATCPVLNCSHEYQILQENECCPTCSAAGQLESACHMHGMLHKDGEEWKRDQCTSCTCSNGAVSCHTLPCEYFNKPCPPGYRRVESEYECCPRCEVAPGVCVVFGDPHYRTFDGLLFNFQGACKYTLAETCRNKNGFKLSVNNDGRRSNTFSWTKSLTLKMPRAKVKLCQKLRTKINGRIVKAPYEMPGILNMTQEGQAIAITTPKGIRVLWDGISYVEVEVPVEMRNRMCGLCGNFNNDVADDLTTKGGSLVDTPYQMALSWSTGRVRQCSRKMNNDLNVTNSRRTQRLTCPVSADQAFSKCGLLNSTVFQACHSIVSIDKFYESCVLDMCECRSTRRCECDTLQAYARQCQRLGVPILEWRKHSKCGGLECPHGAEYMECAPPCRATCRNPTPNPRCYTQRCRAGCYCPPPTVLHRGACIPVEKCRKSKKKMKKSL